MARKSRKSFINLPQFAGKIISKTTEIKNLLAAGDIQKVQQKLLRSDKKVNSIVKKQTEEKIIASLRAQSISDSDYIHVTDFNSGAFNFNTRIIKVGNKSIIGFSSINESPNVYRWIGFNPNNSGTSRFRVIAPFSKQGLINVHNNLLSGGGDSWITNSIPFLRDDAWIFWDVEDNIFYYNFNIKSGSTATEQDYMPLKGWVKTNLSKTPIEVKIEDRQNSGGSGSGSESASGNGVGTFLYNDSSILKMWYNSNSWQVVGAWEDTGGGTGFLEIGNWFDLVGSNNTATSTAGFRPRINTVYVPSVGNVADESVTVSGAVVSNPGGYELPVNGTYMKAGTENGKPRFEKSSGNGGVLRIFWAGAWFIYYNNEGLNENGVLYARNSGASLPSGTFNSAGNSPSVTGGTYTGSATITWSPAHASFDGTQYLTIPNPLNGDSSEVFVVCKFDDIPIDEMNGPMIGNIGASSEYERYLAKNTEGSKVYRARFGFARNALTEGSDPGGYHVIGNDTLGVQISANTLETWNLLNFSAASSLAIVGDTFRFSRGNGQGSLTMFLPGGRFGTTTYNNEGPYIGRSTQGGDIKFKGKIAEIMLYNRALTPSERTIVQNYLNNKYSLWT